MWDVYSAGHSKERGRKGIEETGRDHGQMKAPGTDIPRGRVKVYISIKFSVGLQLRLSNLFSLYILTKTA